MAVAAVQPTDQAYRAFLHDSTPLIELIWALLHRLLKGFVQTLRESNMAFENQNLEWSNADFLLYPATSSGPSAGHTGGQRDSSFFFHLSNNYFFIYFPVSSEHFIFH